MRSSAHEHTTHNTYAETRMQSMVSMRRLNETMHRDKYALIPMHRLIETMRWSGKNARYVLLPCALPPWIHRLLGEQVGSLMEVLFMMRMHDAG